MCAVERGIHMRDDPLMTDNGKSFERFVKEEEERRVEGGGKRERRGNMRAEVGGKERVRGMG
jgi:hypothetical protein